MQPASRGHQGIGTWLQRLGPLFALALLVGYSALREGTFLKPENVMNILRQNAFTGIVALGMTFVIVLGGIDLSVGSMMALIGGVGISVLNAALARGISEPVCVAGVIATCLWLGAILGLLNGWLIAKGRLAPFIATLGAMAAYRSLALSLADGGEFRGPTASANGARLFERLGASGVPLPFHAAPGVNVLLHWPSLAFVAAAVLCAVLLRRTRYGRYVIAIGSNDTAAMYSGVPVDRVRVLTYTLSGFLTAISAVLLATRMNSISSSNTGNFVELDAIAAVVIGGTRMKGGSGTILGTVIGVLILGVINNILNLTQVSPYLQGLVKGAIIIAAVLLQRSRSS